MVGPGSTSNSDTAGAPHEEHEVASPARNARHTPQIDANASPSPAGRESPLARKTWSKRNSGTALDESGANDGARGGRLSCPSPTAPVEPLSAAEPGPMVAAGRLPARPERLCLSETHDRDHPEDDAVQP